MSTAVAMDTGPRTDPRRRRPQISRADLSVTLGACAFAAGVLAVTGLGVRALHQPFTLFSRDTVTTLHGNWYVGALSNLGILLWTVAATSLTLGVTLLPKATRPPAAALALTAYLLVDDLFLLHEQVLPQRGIHERWSYVAEVVLAVAAVWLAVRRRRAGLLVLALSLTGFVASLVIDNIWVMGNADIWEDATKFVGIVAWAAYWVAWVVTDLRGQISRSLRVA